VCDNLCKMASRPPLPVIQVHDEEISSKDHKFKLLSMCTLYICELIVGQLRVRKSVRYITHNSYAISVVLSFNKKSVSAAILYSKRKCFLLMFKE